jgi:hypothetical protein
LPPRHHGRFRRTRSIPVALLVFAACCGAARPALAAENLPKPPLEPETSVSDSLVPQRDIGDVLSDLLGKKKVQTEATIERPGLSIVALPSIGYNPAYGVYFGVGASAGGWLGDPQRTRVSVFALNATYSTSQQLSIQLKSDAWVPGNRWNFKGDFRYLDTSQPTYGLGPIDLQVGKYPMNFVMWRFYETAYLRMAGDIYAGVGYHVNLHEEIDDERATAGEPTPYTLYSLGYPSRSVASGVSWNVLIDSRDSPIYATKGVMWNASIRMYSKSLGGDADWQELVSDFRAYPILPRGSGDVLAIWNTLWMTFGQAAYLDLPAIGWDTYGKSGRAYVQGRIRAPNQVYTEAEYRKTLTRDGLWGAVAFVNMTSSTGPSGSFGRIDPGAGLGLRLKFVKRTRTNLTIDYGWGREGSTGLYLGTQEVF